MKAHVLSAVLAFSGITGFSQNAVVGVLSASGGRYVFGQVSMARADQYLLDTQSGRMWQVVVTKEGSNVLVPVLFSAPEGGYSLSPSGTGVAKATSATTEPSGPSAEITTAITEAIAKWMEKTNARDPEYLRYQEEFRRRLTDMWSKAPPTSVQNALAAAELTYKSVKAETDLFGKGQRTEASEGAAPQQKIGQGGKPQTIKR